MLIIIDFDRTLFDADSFKEELSKIARRYGVPKSTFLKVYKESALKGICFVPNRFLHTLAKSKPGLEINKIEKDYSGLVKNAQKFLFSDAENFLKNLSENNKMVLLTYGDKNFQNKKIKYSGIKKYFDEIVITTKFDKTNEVKKVIKKYKKEKIIFIDDSADVVERVKEKLPRVKTIKASRKGNLVKIKRQIKNL